MLDVYTYSIDRPPQSLDLSLTPLDELADAVMDIYDHQRDVVLWFGYLDGWMLTPREEVLLRKALRKFDCALVTCFPFSLSLAWQNEIKTIYTTGGNGAPHTDNDGGAVHDGREAGHGQARERPTFG